MGGPRDCNHEHQKTAPEVVRPPLLLNSTLTFRRDMSFYPAFSIQDPVLEDCKVGRGVLLAVTVTASEFATRPYKAKLLEHFENTVTRTIKSITDS